MTKAEEMFERFVKNTKLQENGCINWVGFVDNGGYGRLTINGVRDGAHRWAWRLTYGEIPDGMFVLHRCDNRLCVNTDHLFLGTICDNNKDRKNKDRSAKGSSHGRGVLTESDVLNIWEQRFKVSATELARTLGITAPSVRDIWMGRNWRWLTHG
jgi:hypothetical protein